MHLDFNTLSMMKLRSSPGEALDKVSKEGKAFIIERNGHQEACLVPVWYFLPDIPKDRISNELEILHQKGEKPSLRFSDNHELEILFKECLMNYEITIRIVLPHGYPNNVPKIYASPIRKDAPHLWHDGALCIFGIMATWNPGKHNIGTVLDLSRKWLSKYSEWEKNEIWPVEG
ncbi:MAG: hypothetical protein WC496_00635 [Phycisphaerae bacterium]|jgi:hypothetical protein